MYLLSQRLSRKDGQIICAAQRWLMLEKMMEIGQLYDFYGALLTEKQRECIELHYLQDFSLAEIAEESHVSRQAVYDILRRAEQLLQEYEEKLQLVGKTRQDQKKVEQAIAELEKYRGKMGPSPLPEIDKALICLNEIIDTEE